MFGPTIAPEQLVLWTVRVSVALYLVSLALRMNANRQGRPLDRARLAWTFGYIAFLTHVALAFHFHHHWSHAEAWESTAKQTEAVTGLAWGGGIYANYLFILVWGLDVAWWWVWPDSYRARSTIVEWVIQGYLAFIVFNATVVFGSGATRWFALAGFAGLGYLLWCKLSKPARRIQ